MRNLFCSRRPVGGAGATPLSRRSMLGQMCSAQTATERRRYNAAARITRQLPRVAAVLFLSYAANAGAITLDAAFARTLEKNPEIVQARIALEQAAGRRLVLRSNALPDVRIQGLAGVQGGKPEIGRASCRERVLTGV